VLLVVLLEGEGLLPAKFLDGNPLVLVARGVHNNGGGEHDVPQGLDGAGPEQRLVVSRHRGHDVRPRRLVGLRAQ